MLYIVELYLFSEFINTHKHRDTAGVTCLDPSNSPEYGIMGISIQFLTIYGTLLAIVQGRR